MQKFKIEEKLEESNQKLAQVLKENKIVNLRITSLGNSIGSGYSMQRITKPLLLRNETLKPIMVKMGILTDIKHFARMQNNCDEHIYSWLVTNKKESEIHKMNLVDYGNSSISQQNYGLTNDLKQKYYSTSLIEDNGLQDILFASGTNLANILIYNGGTGSFLDSVTRNGKLSQMLTYGLKRDTTSLEATLKYIQEVNRENGTNVQVYLCGAPNFLGLRITEIINYRLKKIAKQYANVVYVEPIISKFFYPNMEANKEKLTTLKKILSLRPDIHYDEIEYLKLNHQIIKSIIENYSITKALIETDRELLQFARYIELENQLLLETPEYLNGTIRSIISSKIFTTKLEEDKYQEKLEKYLNERFPYDFYYLNKKKLKHVLKK